MKLFYSPTSPYVRKVMACAIARGIDHRIETIRSNPHQSPADLVQANPLSKVPCLITEEGTALFDSPVICEYLDSIGPVDPLFPPAGHARWRALTLQAIGDGMLDASILRRMEQGRPKEAARDAVMARQAGIIARTLDQLEAEGPERTLHIGTIAVACALGYLDFRFASEDWRSGRERLARWYETIADTPAIARTAPAE